MRITTKDGNVEAKFGFYGTPVSGEMLLAKGVEGELKHTWMYPIKEVLKLFKQGEAHILFSDKGAMVVERSSEHIDYRYIISAQTK